ncbi:MAG: carboxypeptidase-like regulatory domain-containing protein [Bryobacteraceae bacterium]
MTADLETGTGGTFGAAVDLPAGEYRVDITKPNYADATLRLRIPLQSPLAVRLVRFGSISGRITDTQNRPMGRATVLPMVADGNGQFRRVSIGASAQVDDTGRYRLYNLPPGSYAVAVSWATMNPTVVSKPADSCFGAQDRIADFRTVESVRIDIAPGGTVEGRIESSAGKTPAVALTALDAPEPSAQLALPDGEGRFRFLQLRPGRYRVRAEAASQNITVHGGVCRQAPGSP